MTMTTAERKIAEAATYWLHFSPVRPGDDYYEVTSDEGTVETFDSYDEAIAWLDASGETYHDATDAA